MKTESKKVFGSGSYFPGVFTPCQVGLQILVLRFPHFLHVPTQNSKDLGKSTHSSIPKPEKPLGYPKSPYRISLLWVPLKILERLIHVYAEPTIDPLLLQEQVGFWHRRLTVDQVTLQTQDIEDSFSAKKAGAYLSISEQPKTLCGIVVSPAGYCDCYLADTWSAWSQRWLAIAASPLSPETANGAGYDASRKASHSDLSCHPFFLTFTSLTCQ